MKLLRALIVSTIAIGGLTLGSVPAQAASCAVNFSWTPAMGYHNVFAFGGHVRISISHGIDPTTGQMAEAAAWDAIDGYTLACSEVTVNGVTTAYGPGFFGTPNLPPGSIQYIGVDGVPVGAAPPPPPTTTPTHPAPKPTVRPTPKPTATTPPVPKPTLTVSVTPKPTTAPVVTPTPQVAPVAAAPTSIPPAISSPPTSPSLTPNPASDVPSSTPPSSSSAAAAASSAGPPGSSAPAVVNTSHSTPSGERRLEPFLLFVGSVAALGAVTWFLILWPKRRRNRGEPATT